VKSWSRAFRRSFVSSDRDGAGAAALAEFCGGMTVLSRLLRNVK